MGIERPRGLPATPFLLRIALVGAALGSAGASCNGSHEGEAVTAESCASCHQDEYEATEDPSHTADTVLYHQQCMDCHSVRSWSPALAGPHPEDEFKTIGTSHDYACLDCHNFERGTTSEDGADTDCVGCHDGAHTPEVATRRHLAIPSFTLEGYIYNEPPWCGKCHFGGRGFGKDVPHPEEAFPILAAPHNYECQDCHDTTRATTLEGNTDCTGCHDQGAHEEAAEVDNHEDVPAYVFDASRPDFCLDCHAQPEPLEEPVRFQKPALFQ